jgi:CBS domain-containing protein
MASFDTALVRDAMHAEILSCPAEAPLREVARTMARNRVHFVVVEGPKQQGRWAIVSDETLLRFIGPELDDRTAGWAAVADYPTVVPSETLDRAVDLMLAQQVRHLVVVEEETRRPLGVLSTLDVAAVLAA